METTYDIFKRLDDAGPPLWMETVGNLDQARQRLAGLAKQRGTYLVFDPRMGRIIEMPERSPNAASRPSVKGAYRAQN